MNQPITTEYALKRLEAALAIGDTDEIKKWDICIRANNDMRIRAKQRARFLRESLIRAKQRQSMRI